MAKGYKRESFLFTAIDYFSLKEHFEDMARRGWMLDKIGIFTARYKKIDPQDLVFSVDVYPKLNVFESIDKDDVKSYRNLCEDAGWKYVASSNNLQVFYSEKEDNLIPVQTDEEIKEKVIEKSIFMDLLSMILNILVLSNSLRRLIPFDYTNLFNNVELFYPISIPLLMLMALIYITGHLQWLIRAKLSIRKNRPLPRTNFFLAKIKGIIVLGTSIVALLIFIISMIADSLIQSEPIFIFIAPLIFIPVLVFIYKKKIVAMNIGRFKKIAIVTVSVFALYILTFIIAINLAPHDFNRELEVGYIGFTLKDFELGNKINKRSFSNEGSLLVPKKSDYWETNIDRSIRTIYIKSINEKVAKYIFDEMIKEEYVRYERKFSSASGEYGYFDEAYYINSPYQGTNNDNIILLKDNEILLIEGNVDFSLQKNIEVVINKLINE